MLWSISKHLCAKSYPAGILSDVPREEGFVPPEEGSVSPEEGFLPLEEGFVLLGSEAWPYCCKAC